jgi:endonuclease/exonuclease/phosphatase family metal-dependent hydrolase
MSTSLLFKRLIHRASAIAGAVFFLWFALAATSCDKKRGTSDWGTSNASEPSSPEVVPTDRASVSKSVSPKSSKTANSDAASAESLRFLNYNVENWLMMDRYVDHKVLQNRPKPESEKKAITRLLVAHSPDVIGLCEIGTPDDLAEIKESLKTAGLDLPFSHYTGGCDPVRHLGLLSRFPITATSKPVETEFKIEGQTYELNRSFLDATIQAHGKAYRFIGAHLKSKREVPQGDQEQMRIHEARLLRRHVDSILSKDADARLIVYGDFNDSRPSIAFKTVTGTYNDPGYLTAIPFKDSRGEAWTHYWELHDIYSRIDFVAVSRGMRPDVDFHGCYLIDDPEWKDASDHRPQLAIFR